MQKLLNNKTNLFKAIAILVVVSGHLEFSLIPMFPPYSFQVILFFFIAGVLFNPKYSMIEYIKRRFKSLMIPYFLYEMFYLALTIIITPFIHKFWGLPITLKNEFLTPFLTGHQLDLISPLWFVPCLFITLIIYKSFNYIKCSQWIRLVAYFVVSLLAIQLQKYSSNVSVLWILRTMFALFFVELGYFYKQKIENKIDIFNPKIFSMVIVLQSVLWLTNQDFTAQDGVGLHFLLVWGQYNNFIVPILTSLTGIYITLFLVEILFDKTKDWTFLHKIGQNSYHIMANHLLVFNMITYSFLALKGIDFGIKNNADIYWFYFPLKTTYFYFVIGIIMTTYIGEFLKYLHTKIIKLLSDKN